MHEIEQKYHVFAFGSFYNSADRVSNSATEAPSDPELRRKQVSHLDGWMAF